MVTITEPGVYYDLPAADYHAQHEWLSWSRMKHLIPPSTPAHFKASMRRGKERKRHFDLGKVIHALVLGEDDEFTVVQAVNRKKESYDAADYATKSAQEHRDAIYADGNVPILRHELEAAEAMAAAVAEHKVANALLTNGKPEVSLFWIDPETKVKCRARLDWLPDAVKGQRLVVPDLKSTGREAGASPDEFAKASAKLGYYGQMQHYRDGVIATGLHPDPAFVFVAVETADPHLVSVGQFNDPEDQRLARAIVDHCRRLYRDCAEADNWPGYPGGVNDLVLPMWLHYQHEDIAGAPAEDLVI